MLPTQKKRIILLSIVFLCTGIFAWWSNNQKGEISELNDSETSVSLSDTAAIKEIRIQKVNGELLIIKKDLSGNGWILNDEFKVRTQLMNYLKYGFNKLVIKRPVPASMENSIVYLLKQKGIHCKVILKNEVREFAIISNPNDINSSYYLEKKDKSPLIVHVPGVKGDITNLMNLNVNDWKARDIFSSTYQTIMKLEINYKSSTNEDFQIERKDKELIVKNLSDVDTSKLKKYVNLFTYLSSDGFVNKDSIFKNFDLNQPDVSIKIQDHDSTKNNNLRIYFSKKNNKMYGLTDRNKDLLLLNPQVFKFVFINKKYFSSKGN